MCAAKSLQSCPTLCNPIDGSPPGPAVPGILQARVLEWVATGVGCHFLLQCMKVKSENEVSCARLFATPWTAAHQTPPSMGFSRQEYWSGLPLLFQVIFPTQGSNLGLLHCSLYQLLLLLLLLSHFSHVRLCATP